jgi:hypothetical protein
MKKLVEYKKLDDDVREISKKIDPDSYGISVFALFETTFVGLIKECVDDKYDWISYWLYECDCGKSDFVDSVKNKRGEKIPLRTLGNLYDCIKNKND